MEAIIIQNMKAIIKTDNRNLFYSLLDFLRTIPVSVEINEDAKKVIKKADTKQKKFNPRDYEGILSHLNLDVEKELVNMRKGWKRNS